MRSKQVSAMRKITEAFLPRVLRANGRRIRKTSTRPGQRILTKSGNPAGCGNLNLRAARRIAIFCLLCTVHLCPPRWFSCLLPWLQLPVKVDIIKHPAELTGKSTSSHAVILAPSQVTIHLYPHIPDYDPAKVSAPESGHHSPVPPHPRLQPR